MSTRRPLPHQQQQPPRDRVAQAQQQAGYSEFQHQAGASERSAEPGRIEHGRRREWKTQH
jgi:hypothetical protein